MKKQFSLRALLACMLFVALLFGGRLIYYDLWNEHCRSLEPSLFKFILEEELSHDKKQGQKTYLATGVPQDSEWTPLPRAFIEEIGLEQLRSVKDTSGDAVFYIGNIRWVDWQTVMVDHGDFHAVGRGHGFEDARFRFVDGSWTCVEIGSEWISPGDG